MTLVGSSRLFTVTVNAKFIRFTDFSEVSYGSTSLADERVLSGDGNSNWDRT